MKRFISALMVGIFLFTTACSSGDTADANSDSSTGENNTESGDVVRMIVPGVSENSVIDPISGITTLGLGDYEDYINENIDGATVELISIPWEGWIQKLEVMMTSGEADIGFYTNQVAVPDWFSDLTPYLESDDQINFDTLDDLFVESANQNLKYKTFTYPEAQDQVFGIPLSQSSTLIMYDKQLFEDWGIEEPTSDTTFDELVAMSEQMTGENPITGKKNYGAYLGNSWNEWFSISYDAVKPLFMDEMDINNFDMDEYANYIPDSPEVLNFFEKFADLIEYSPEGISTGSGSEAFFTDDNNIAINYNTITIGSTYLKYLYAGDTEITDRFTPLFIPTSSDNQQGFPEYFKLGVAKNANDADLAWDVLKQIVTNKDIVNFYLTNYAADKLPAIKDTEGMDIMDYDLNKDRYEYQSETVFITDDYWNWRISMQNVINSLISKTITPEEARTEFYNGVVDWVDNTKAQIGN